jgi:hypothetical protein
MNEEQPELFGVIFRQPYPFRLRANDVIRIDGRLGRIIRVTESAAVVVMNRPAREFVTRFDKRVRLRPSPVIFRIAANSEAEIINRKQQKKRKTERKKS